MILMNLPRNIVMSFWAIFPNLSPNSFGNLFTVDLNIFNCFFVTGCSSMDVSVPSYINALNATTVKIPCIFTSCYKIDATKFNMNWTYQESVNHTEEKVKMAIFYGIRVFKS